jgi:hypothetical protein
MDSKKEWSSDRFWEWAFEQSGKNPLAWRHSAENLLQAAAAVKEKVLPLGGMMHSLAAVQAMLLGLGVECLLKGMWIKRGNTLTSGGRIRRIRKAGEHDLKLLANAAGVSLSDDEASVLNKLTRFVMFAGRYPIATTWEQMKPVKNGRADTESPMFISQRDLDVAEALAARLMQAVLPWT